jgi:hypothetical protein
MVHPMDAAREYLVEMCEQLASIAHKNQLDLTAHLLEMAKLSVTEESQDQRQISESH